jgi:hypothetical protein
MTGSNNVKNWKALNSGHLRQKLQSAGTVITNRLLGHTLDHKTSKIIAPLCKTFYENMTHLSSSGGKILCVSPPPSFRRSEPSAHVCEYEHHPILADTNAEMADTGGISHLVPREERFPYTTYADVPSLQRT